MRRKKWRKKQLKTKNENEYSENRINIEKKK